MGEARWRVENTNFIYTQTFKDFESLKVKKNRSRFQKQTNFKNIHIGQMIEKRVTESGIEISRICNFFKCNEEDINQMYLQENLSTDVLLKWSKLLEYDFFRIYSPVCTTISQGANIGTYKIITSAIPKKHLYKRNYRFHLGANFIGRNDENTSDGKI